MKIDWSQEQLLPRLQALVYTLAAVAIIGLLIDQYRQGLYSLVLTNAIAIPAFLFSAIFVYINRDRDGHPWVNYALVLVLSALALYRLPTYPQLMLHYLYALPLFSYFCLPMWHATWFNLLMGALMTAMIWSGSDTATGIRTGTNYALLLGSAWCFAYLTQMKSRALKRLSLTDPCSGVYNHRHFQPVLGRELARAGTHGQPVSLIALELDDWSQWLDIHGRAAVLQFLPHFAEAARQQIRAGDDIFRLDQALFVLLLPNCPEDGAIVLMERIKRVLQQRTWKPFAEINISAAAVSWQQQESAEAMQKRLLAKLRQQRRASLQLAAFQQ
ncbi:hypothetical protein GCM10011297_09710 [Bacterioplanes sanyensis]|uniref:GGDEF domain-containing protein n=1 Tax=Bacterioplanes sanyensis TaxID=1249553 RepID=UPI001676D048|nr:GGDEF domain-containing protein [Bacterioplanes sanyensis]GGY38591.1 hypothetical protein GCM10011297_09710 [Bacterioplanes sanyensis]